MDPFTIAALASQAGPLLQGFSGGASNDSIGAATSGGGLLSPLTSIASSIRSLISGPGRGEMRRGSARAAVAQSAPLTRLQAFLRGRNASPAQIEAALREYFPRDPEARAAFAAIMARVGELGGSGKAQGQEANTLGDVLKFVLLGETVTKRELPTNPQLAAAVVGQASPVTTPLPPPVAVPPASLAAAAPASLTEAARAEGPLRFPSFAGATPASFTPTMEAPMGSFLDSLGAALPALSAALVPSSSQSTPFVLPGGAVAAGLGSMALGGLSNLLPSVGLPFVDLAPSGGAALFEPFRRTASGARAQLHIQVNPATDKPEFFAPVGRPLIFSRDFATVKRMKRLGGKMVTATGGNRGRMARRRRGGR